MEKKWLDLPWQKVRDSVEVKLWNEEGELFVLAKSEGRFACTKHPDRRERSLCTGKPPLAHTILCKLAVFSSVQTVSRRKLDVFRLRPNEDRASKSNRFSRKSKSCSIVWSAWCGPGYLNPQHLHE